MNRNQKRWIAGIATAFAAVSLFVFAASAQNRAATGTEQGSQPSRANASHLPVWAYSVVPRRRRPGGARRGGRRGFQPPPDTGPLQHVPGSSRGYTKGYIRNLFSVPDWFPNSHPPMPQVVAHGHPPSVQACAYCHLPNGQGRPENESIAGLPEGYILQQISDFKDGLRKSSSPYMGSVNLMVRIAKALDDSDARAAAAYFSSLHYKPWIRVVETDTVPVTQPKGLMMVAVPGGKTEPIGNRVIEVSVNQDLTELRDPNSGFIAYVPKSSIQRGERLVMTGDNGETVRCTICHGPDLKGLGNVPSIVGRSPSQMARELIDIQTGARNGPYTQLMKLPVRNLNMRDIVDIVAYLASLRP